MRNPSESNDPKQSKVVASIIYKRISYSRLLTVNSSDELHTYSVTVRGKSGEKEVEITRIYDEHHPLAAVGCAVVQYLRRFVVCTITQVDISERVEKIKSATGKKSNL